MSVLESPDPEPTARPRRASDGVAPDPHPDRRIGQLVDGKYFILRRLACGGMGSVYEARHRVVGRHFALKFLHDHYAQRSSMVQRFLREAQAAGSIASEHIIGVLDYGSSDGVPYLVMELVRGQDLRELLSESPRLEERRAVRIVLDACRGLEIAHEHGLIHRDLKPANICVTRRSDGREVAKVIDFGVAKLRDGVDLSEEGTLIGTVGYMAPEQLTDHKQLDGRADVYALGVILYQALSGRPPHHCQRAELLYRIVSIDPPTLSEISSGLSAGLSEVVQRALARNRELRYASIREFARALEPYAGEPAQLSVEAAQPPIPQALKPSAGDLGTAVTELESAPTWVALRASAQSQTRATRLCDRQCERQSSGESEGNEEYCQQLPGVSPLPPPPTRDQHLSQRALVLSVGALVLSVVAMTTMFAFVYSQGSQALEVGARPRPALAVASARPAPTLDPAGLALTPSNVPALATSNADAIPASLFGPSTPPGWATASSSDPVGCDPSAATRGLGCASESASNTELSVSVRALRGTAAASSGSAAQSTDPEALGN